MEFEDSQFQAAPVGSGSVSFTAASVPSESAPSANGLNGSVSRSASAVTTGTAAAVQLVDSVDAAPAVFIDQDALENAGQAALADEDPFFQHYTPPAPAAPPSVPEVVDPRVEWRKQNNEVLKKKDAEEAAAKQKTKETASQYLAKYYEVRTTTLTQRKANNRKSDAHQKEVEVPANGTPWEKINALVNLNSGNHQKDVSRYKALLITCKAKNVAIHA
ncbi:hypothetical protein Vretimale_2773 [Volvox reticuliferus]|uniref:Clathrin light chain n=1 Tax=Volvox reticuliferus TaxID=1737510 RepID=A0A8J4D8M6_9CHLO|nr:hypothetical protein Vretifemale_6872 [Volvox reticuliferus]GIL97289.1 hypothetical protein Vretimale_2773 [Volvox reticuliferus]